MSSQCNDDYTFSHKMSYKELSESLTDSYYYMRTPSKVGHLSNLPYGLINMPLTDPQLSD